MNLYDMLTTNNNLKGIHILTAGGYVQVKKKDFEKILNETYNNSHLGCSGTSHNLNPSENYLYEEMECYNIKDNILYAVI